VIWSVFEPFGRNRLNAKNLAVVACDHVWSLWSPRGAPHARHSPSLRPCSPCRTEPRQLYFRAQMYKLKQDRRATGQGFEPCKTGFGDLLQRFRGTGLQGSRVAWRQCRQKSCCSDARGEKSVRDAGAGRRQVEKSRNASSCGLVSERGRLRKKESQR
jgi:hypothetical protein